MPKSDLSFDGEYAPVAERVRLFYERYPYGCIHSRLVSRTSEEITFRAVVYRAIDDRRPSATGWASERPGDGEVNAVACLENAETSAVGRALANLGFTASRNRPSAEEMAKAQRARNRLGGAGGPVPQADQGAVRSDLIELLLTARRRGARPAEVAALGERLAAGPLAVEEMRRIEDEVRGWLEERDAAM